MTPIPTPQFRYYDLAEGLPSSNVYTIVQDPQGVIWMGTGDGLVRFDGVHVRVFRHDPRDRRSLPANDISEVMIDHRQRLWVGGEGTGLNLYRPGKGDFRNWHHVDGDPDSLDGDDLGALAEGKDGSIWVGVMGHGLDRLMPDGRIEHFRHDASNPASLASNLVLSLHVETDGTLLVGSLSGLDRIDPDGRLRHVAFQGLPGPPRVWGIDGSPGHLRLATNKGLYRLDTDGTARPMLPGLIPAHIFITSLRGAGGSLWVGTNSGLYWVGPNGRSREFLLRHQASKGMPGALVWKLMRDQEGGLWIATRSEGVAYLGPDWRQFSIFRHRAGDPDSLDIGRVLAQTLWQGHLWVGGQDGRVDRIDPVTGYIDHLHLNLGRESVTALAPAGDGSLWVGHTNGLLLYRHGRTIEVERPALHGGVNRVVTDARGNAYASQPAGGVLRIDRSTLRARRIPTRNGTVKDEDVTELAWHEGHLWRSSAGGLARMEPQSGAFVDVPGIARGRILGFAFHSGGLWVVRPDSIGHYRLRSDGSAVRDRTVGVDNGWPEISLKAMACDPSGRVWLTGRARLWRFNPRSGSFRSYGAEDGLPSSEFSSFTLTRMPDGMVYSGTLHGLVGWNPHEMHTRPQPLHLVLQRVAVKRDGRVHVLPVNGNALNLRWNDRELQVVVQALSYVDPKRNHYRFRLDGLDSNWIDTGNRGERDFSGLMHGNYVLHMQAAGPGNAWTALAPLKIHIALPPWLRWWAWTAYVFIALFLVWALVTLSRRRMEQRHRMQLAERERSMAEQASAAKSSFLATLGHEIRTPMTGVLGMAELLLHSPLQSRQREYAEAIQRSGTLLLRLVNEALDMARIEAGRLELDVADFDPREVVRDVMQLERGVAESKGLRLAAEIEDRVPVRLRGDGLRIEQILLNLVSNALKFTRRGSVELKLDWVDGGLDFRVADTGPGIPEDARERLFRRYEQVDGPQRRSGSGLGLAICRELALLMGGRCELLVSGAQGSTFRVWLPLPVVEVPVVRAVREDRRDISRKLLLIEDDETVAGVIRGLLETAGHRVRHAAQGLAGLAELQSGDFDAVLLDLDLPGLDGFAVARMMRDSGVGLPIIAITARSGGDEEEQAREAGMDGFLRKPLSGEQLQEALRRLLG